MFASLAKPSATGKSMKVLFIFLVLLYAALLLIHPQLGPNDEFAFLPTLQSGKLFPMYWMKDFPYYNDISGGRFGPLGGQEFNVVALFSHSPGAYYAFNVVELLLFAVIFIWILREFSTGKTLIYLAGTLVLLTPGLTLVFFKLLHVEKNILFLLTLFFAFYLLFQKRQQTIYFISALLCVNVAIYYKEPVFMAVAIFAAGHLLLSWKTSNRKAKLLDGLLIGSAALYIGIYLIMVMPSLEPATYLSAATDNNILALLKTVSNYALFSDPLPTLVLIPLLLWRMFRVFVRKDQAHPVLDPMAAAGVAYMSVFFILKLYSPYYLLPVYLFALPPIFYFLQKGALRGVFWTASFSITAFVLVMNAIPLAVHYVAYYKYVPINFNKTMDFLVEDINRRYAGQRLNIFFYGVDRGSHAYFIAGEYLRFKGLSIRKFDLKSDMEARNPGPPVWKASPFDRPEDIAAVDPQHTYKYPQLPLSVYQPGPLFSIQRGDYLVVSPESLRNYDREYIENLKKDYDLVFYTQSPLSIPLVGLKTFVKYLLSQELSPTQKASGVILNENLLHWPDYYVFVRK
jgi:hypothetical protein